jgi:hypothetical protein
MVAISALVAGTAGATVVLDENWNLTARGPQWGNASVDTTVAYSGNNSLKVVPMGDGNPQESGIGVWLPLDVSVATDGMDPTTTAIKFQYKIDPTGVVVPEGQTFGNVNFKFRLESNVWGQYGGGTYLDSAYVPMTADGQWNEATVTFTGWNATPPAGATIGSLRLYRDWFSGAGVANAPNVWFDQFEIVPEPASMSLIGLGALALIRRRRAA